MKFCKDCVNYMYYGGIPRPPELIKCRASGKEGEIYPVNGELDYEYAMEFRKPGQYCGPNANFFVRKQ